MITLRHEGATAVLTLMRGERGNALSTELVEALIGAVDACIADPALDTLVLAADGADFCNGFDLGAPATDGELLWRFVRIEHLLSTLWHAPLRTVALAQGRAFGAGADLFAACDVRLAAAGTQWRFPGAAFGIVLGTRRLAEQVGTDRALQWIGSGAVLDADQALAHGLATGIVAPGAWREHVPPLAIDRATFALLRAAARADHRDADLAALVRSAMPPGLAARIASYRAAQRAQARKPDPAPAAPTEA